MKSHRTKQNIFFIIVLLILFIPQTRQPLQVLLHKGLSYINSSTILREEERKAVNFDSWQLQSDDHTTIRFSDMKGKVILINFWATWCPPCIAEMPSLQALYNDYKGDVEFLFVTNDDFGTVEAFKDKRQFSFEAHNPISEMPAQLTTSSIPRTFIINKKGEVVVDESGAVNWNSKDVRNQLDQLLAE